ncbi:disease resistance protein Pik-2-like [Triticum aestivum]|uniref:disease resistance protein Pik-2-like n=1 Tax=Triticum aestivum TaxID=4565 RepID=UPI001D015891|nr:disease resistance protein Pik-2-like [Triticum aestivum]
MEKELKIMHATLQNVVEVPRDELEEGIKIWAGKVSELSYKMEYIVDMFLVCVNDESSDPVSNSNKLKWLGDNMFGLFTKWKACHQIANTIKDIKNQVNYVAKQHNRYKVDHVVCANVAIATTTTPDPSLLALYNKVSDLVGMNEPRDELIKRLTDANDQMEIVSIAGFGGLGKTTLAKDVYDNLKPRYLIVIDDIWNLQSWSEIKLALIQNSCAMMMFARTTSVFPPRGEDDVAQQR